MPKPLIVKQDPDAEVATEVLAADIQAISEGVRKLRAGRLNDKALITLLAESTNVGKRTIKDVLDGLSGLEAAYLRKRA